MKNVKRIIAFLMCLCMLIYTSSFTAFSAETTTLDDRVAFIKEYVDRVLYDKNGDMYDILPNGFNVFSKNPVTWITQDGTVTVPSSIMNQQYFFRLLDGLSALTGDDTYVEYAKSQYEKYMTDDSLHDSNGLFYSGNHRYYDIISGEIFGSVTNRYEHKYNFPHYDLMFDTNTDKASDFIEAFWNAMLSDWETLLFNRHGDFDKEIEEDVWSNQYDENHSLWLDNVRDGLTFINTGADLIYSAVKYYQNTGNENALTWAKRLWNEYYQARDENTNILVYQYTKLGAGDRGLRQFANSGYGERALEGKVLLKNIASSIYGIAVPAMAQMASELNDIQWLAQLKESCEGFVDTAYNTQTGKFKPILTDGTDLTGYVADKDIYFFSVGEVATEYSITTDMLTGLTYVAAVTGSEKLWNFVRSKYGSIGDIGTAPGENVSLRLTTTGANTSYAATFLALYELTDAQAYLDMALRMCDNFITYGYRNGYYTKTTSDPENTIFINSSVNNLAPLITLKAAAYALGRPDAVPDFPIAAGGFLDDYSGETGTRTSDSITYNQKSTDTTSKTVTVQRGERYSLPSSINGHSVNWETDNLMVDTIRPGTYTYNGTSPDKINCTLTVIVEDPSQSEGTDVYTTTLRTYAQNENGKFSVVYQDENLFPGEWYSFLVLKPGTDFTQMIASDILCMKQVLADNEKTISVLDFALRNNELTNYSYGDVYLGGRGLKFSHIAELLNHNCQETCTHYEAVPATCDEDGNLEYWQCNICERCYSDIESKSIIYNTVEYAGHEMFTVTATEPSCTQDGNKLYYHCTKSQCNKLFSDKNATIQTSLEEVVISALNHKNAIFRDSSQAITCDNPGYIPHTYCPDCEKYFSDESCEYELTERELYVTIPHELGEEIAAVAPTCTEKGQVAHYTCSECGNHFEDAEANTKLTSIIIEALGHTWDDNGNNFTCSVCDILRCVIGSGDSETEIYAEDLNESVLSDEEKQNYNVALNIELISSPSVKMQSAITSMNLGINEVLALDITVLKGISEITQEVTQTPQPLKFKITLPNSMEVRDNYYVLRLHQDNVQSIGETANSDGEYFSVDKENNCITLYANKFSEYVIISEEEPRVATGIGTGGTSSPKPSDSGGSAGGGSDKTEDKPQEEIVQGDETTNYNFSDVSESDWFFDAVKYASNNGLMKGVSEESFAPNDNVTRAMFVTILYRLESEPSVKATKKFTDVKTGEWYTDAVSWANEKGIVSGVDSNNFAPGNAISREQLATMLYRYAIYKKCNISAAENTSLAEYADAENISQYALSAIKWAIGEKVINGKTQTTLNPQDNTTRAEVATMLMRIADKLS